MPVYWCGTTRRTLTALKRRLASLPIYGKAQGADPASGGGEDALGSKTRSAKTEHTLVVIGESNACPFIDLSVICGASSVPRVIARVRLAEKLIPYPDKSLLAPV